VSYLAGYVKLVAKLRAKQSSWSKILFFCLNFSKYFVKLFLLHVFLSHGRLSCVQTPDKDNPIILFNAISIWREETPAMAAPIPGIG